MREKRNSFWEDPYIDTDWGRDVKALIDGDKTLEDIVEIVKENK